MRPVYIVATFAAFVATLLAVPIDNLRVAGALGQSYWLALFLLPPACVALSFLLLRVTPRRVSRSACEVLSGIPEGIAFALALQGLFAVYFWYLDPSEPHLEPLVVLLGLAAGVAEFSHRRVESLIKGQATNAA